MMGCAAIVIIVLMVCITDIINRHIENCNKNGIGWYADPKYEERIRKLEKIVMEKEEKVK